MQKSRSQILCSLVFACLSIRQKALYRKKSLQVLLRVGKNVYVYQTTKKNIYFFVIVIITAHYNKQNIRIVSMTYAYNANKRITKINIIFSKNKPFIVLILIII